MEEEGGAGKGAEEESGGEEGAGEIDRGESEGGMGIEGAIERERGRRGVRRGAAWSRDAEWRTGAGVEKRCKGR